MRLVGMPYAFPICEADSAQRPWPCSWDCPSRPPARRGPTRRRRRDAAAGHGPDDAGLPRRRPDPGEVQAGEQVSPALTWMNVPPGTQSFVLHMRDPDVAPRHRRPGPLAGLEHSGHRDRAAGECAEGRRPGGRQPSDRRQRSGVPRPERAGQRSHAPLHFRALRAGHEARRRRRSRRLGNADGGVESHGRARLEQGGVWALPAATVSLQSSRFWVQSSKGITRIA